MSAAPTDAELEQEVQGLPLTGYGAPYSFMRNLVLAVTKPADARKFLANLHASDLLDFGGKCTGWPEGAGVNLGFTYEGLRTLGAPAHILALLKEKSPAFSDGAALRAARYLGDTGVSAVERWKRVFQRQAAHVWITIHADDMLALEGATGRLREFPGATTGLAGWQHPDGVPDGEHLTVPNDKKARFVHFGFRDNLTRPSILDKDEKLPKGKVQGDEFGLPPGELLLGYPNHSEANVWVSEETAADVASFLRNGTFGVLRQIEQDEAAFNDFLDVQVQALANHSGIPAPQAFLKAKLCGRWPNGMPLLPGVTVEPAWQPDQRIDFEHDEGGFGCPFGAHIRRANPRDSFLKPKHHRILFRRSIPYGPRYPGTSDDIERGLVGVFFCGRVDDQFELLVSEWLEKNPLGPPNPGRAKDPLSGHHDDLDAGFHIPQAGGPPVILKGFEPFTRTRGTLYALFPSRKALSTIAVGESWRPA
jgi:deferrochelatase/peroxidase EfeB